MDVTDKFGNTLKAGDRVIFPYGGDMHLTVISSMDDQPAAGPQLITAAVMATIPAGLVQIVTDDRPSEVPPTTGQTTTVGGIAP